MGNVRADITIQHGDAALARVNKHSLQSEPGFFIFNVGQDVSLLINDNALDDADAIAQALLAATARRRERLTSKGAGEIS